MMRKSSVLTKNIYVSIILLIAIYSQTAWYTTDGMYYTVFLSCAVTTGFYTAYGREIFPGLIITSIFGVFFMEIIVHNKTLLDAALYTMPMAFLNVITPFMFKGFLLLFKVEVPNTLRDSFYFVLSLVLSVSIMAVLPAIQMSSVNNTTFLFEYKEYSQPLIVGMIVFTTGIVLSTYYDDPLTIEIKGRVWDILFFISFALISYGIFNESYRGLDFMQGASVFILLFVVNAFKFSYRMLIINSWMYVGVYNLIFFMFHSESSTANVSSLNVYLMILFLITAFTKVLIYDLKQKNEELEETKERYEDMVGSTLELFKVRETLSYENIELQESIMRNIFDISLRIFHDVEYATCNLKGTKYVETIDTKGYDKDLINAMKLESNKFRWNHFKPVHIQDGNKMFENALGERYKLFENDIPKIKESVSILIKLNDEEKGAITFDIIEGSENQFSKGDLYNIGAFQSMINSFYEMNVLTIKNNSLRDDIVLSLIRTLELYDQYTGGHSEDVAFIANELARELELSTNDRYDIYWAGIVHDIGKIGISSDIINKKGRLTIDEYNEVKKHPIYGYDILIKSEDLKPIAKLVRHHHEWFNGSGYPDGLKEDNIPFGAQILQVADSVSSMATKRTYQQEKSNEEIIEELKLYSGTQFNPKIAQTMINLINKKKIQEYFKLHKK